MDTTINLPSQDGYSQPHALTVAVNNEPGIRKPFIEANTVQATLTEIKKYHIIPVFHKDNEPLISQVDFIEATQEVVQQAFPSERILSPSIRLSHPIKGRIPEARNKPAKELQEWEQTLYYERMAFIIEVPSIKDTIEGQTLSLVIGGVKAYNLDNLYQKKGTDEHFKVFIGFKVSVCTNMCIWTDGFVGDLKVKNLDQLFQALHPLISSYDATNDLRRMSRLQDQNLTERQFAQLIGRCRLYQHMTLTQKKDIPELHFGDSQINSVCKDYYKDQSFCRDENGDINLWRLYNLFTAANKQSYIDTYIDRAVNATQFTSEIAHSLESNRYNWFLS